MSLMKASALRHVLNGQVPENIPDFRMPIHFNFMKSVENNTISFQNQAENITFIEQ